MSDLMKFHSNIERVIKPLTGLQEPTVPGPVANDLQRTWNGYLITDHGALDPTIFNDVNSVWCNSEIGIDTWPGTQAEPVQTIQQAVLLSTPTKCYIVIEGTFRERVVVASYYNPPGYSTYNINLVHFSTPQGKIAYWKAPEGYPKPEEYQSPWQNIVIDPDNIYQLPKIYFGVGTKGDYIQQPDGKLRYLFPNCQYPLILPEAPFTPYLHSFQWYIDDGHKMLVFPNYEIPCFKALKEIQHFGFEDRIIAHCPSHILVQGSPYGFQWYDPSGGLLRDARDHNPLWRSLSTGEIDFTNPEPTFQIDGTTGTTEHDRGPSYSGWVLSICRTLHHKARFLAADVSINAATEEIQPNQAVTIYQYADGPGWTVFDRWDCEPIIRVLLGTYTNIYIDYFGVGLKAVYDKVYFVNAIRKQFGQYFQTPGEIRVSSGGAFTKITIAGYNTVEDIEYFNGYYYAITKGKIFRSVNGITDWLTVYSHDTYWFMKMNVINNVLFISIANGDPKAYAYTYDGFTINIVNVDPVTDRASILGGLIFQSNGRVGITHGDWWNSEIYTGNPPPSGAGDPPYPFITFQEALLNYEKSDDNNFYHFDNIDMSVKAPNGKIAGGSGITEGRGWKP